MKVKFKFGLLALAILSTGGLVTLMTILLKAIVQHPERTSGVIVGVEIFFFVTITLLIREMKFKWNAVEITENELLVSSFLGLGPTRKIRFNEITGFNRSLEPSKISEGLAIYIYENNKRTIEISDAYCKNFKAFENALGQKVKEMEGEDFSVFKNIKNAFGVPIKLTAKQKKRY